MKRFLVTVELRTEIKKLEAEGLSRKEIADALNVAPSTVTRVLGAVRQYRGERLTPIS